MDHIIRPESATKSSFSNNGSTVAPSWESQLTYSPGQKTSSRSYYERKDRQPILNSKGSGEWSFPGSSVKPDPIHFADYIMLYTKTEGTIDAATTLQPAIDEAY
ncbi:hypothetical protein GHT06_009891 [Daphnia sinensis]|uniref:Uncharacterized protein n=1 Tax=Daphnia sinensis TaxID=1820382 RepID=A0AAD5LR64_9CRUS|nr:hypothetical protein GHT06_009891 [Daphnia sinensis]